MNKYLLLGLFYAFVTKGADGDEEIIKNLEFYQNYELIKDESVFASVKSEIEVEKDEKKDTKKERKQ